MQRCPDLEAVAHLKLPQVVSRHARAALSSKQTTSLPLPPYASSPSRLPAGGAGALAGQGMSALPPLACQLHRLPPTCAFLHPSVCARGAGECFCGCSR